MARPKLYSDDARCSDCETNRPIAGGLCRRCYEYKRRTGKPRPAGLEQQLGGRRAERNYQRLIREQEAELIRTMVRDELRRQSAFERTSH